MTRFATIKEMKWRISAETLMFPESRFSDVWRLGFTEVYIGLDRRAGRWYVLESDGVRALTVGNPLWSMNEAQHEAMQHLDGKLQRVYGIEIVNPDKPVALALDGPNAGEVIRLPKERISSAPWCDRVCVPNPPRLSYMPAALGEPPEIGFVEYDHVGSIIGKLKCRTVKP